MGMVDERPREALLKDLPASGDAIALVTLVVHVGDCLVVRPRAEMIEDPLGVRVRLAEDERDVRLRLDRAATLGRHRLQPLADVVLLRTRLDEGLVALLGDEAEPALGRR